MKRINLEEIMEIDTIITMIIVHIKKSLWRHTLRIIIITRITIVSIKERTTTIIINKSKIIEIKIRIKNIQGMMMIVIKGMTTIEMTELRAITSRRRFFKRREIEMVATLEPTNQKFSRNMRRSKKLNKVNRPIKNKTTTNNNKTKRI